MDLALIPLEDLIDELKQRSDAVLIGYVKEQFGKLDVRIMFNDPIGALGLAVQAQNIICREIDKTQQDQYE